MLVDQDDVLTSVKCTYHRNGMKGIQVNTFPDKLLLTSGCNMPWLRRSGLEGFCGADCAQVMCGCNGGICVHDRCCAPAGQDCDDNDDCCGGLDCESIHGVSGNAFLTLKPSPA